MNLIWTEHKLDDRGYRDSTQYLASGAYGYTYSITWEEIDSRSKSRQYDDILEIMTPSRLIIRCNCSEINSDPKEMAAQFENDLKEFRDTLV